MATHGTNEQFLAAAKATTSKALQLMESTENAIKMENNPVQKALLRDAATELREASQAVIVAARALRQNPNDATAKANFEHAHQRLEDAIRRVVQTTQGELYDNTPQGRLAASTTALEGALREVNRVAIHSPKDLPQEIAILVILIYFDIF
jgi:CHASE3 domain sensor protein